MPYQDIHTKHLNDIIELIKANEITGANGALEKFNTYLDTIQDIGPFDPINWRQDWRRKVWKLGVEFKNLNPQQFLRHIDDKLALLTTTNKEVIEFIRSEIAFNFLPDNECKKQIEKLIEKYTLNPEFRNTLGHFYGRENKSLLAIAEYKLALKIEPNNFAYIRNRFIKEHEYLNKLISEGKYTTGQAYIESVFSEKFYKEVSTFYHNAFVDLKLRIADHLIFQGKIKELEKEFKNKLQEELNSERKRIIEVLGFFSAIVAFILSTVSIGKNFSFIEAVYFIVALGIILILFAVALSTLFSSTKTALFKDKKFWILTVGLILLFLFIITTDTISNIIKHLTK